jgi:hypothetical protein
MVKQEKVQAEFDKQGLDAEKRSFIAFKFCR